THCCYSALLAPRSSLLFLFNDPPTTAIYTLSLHDALPIYHFGLRRRWRSRFRAAGAAWGGRHCWVVAEGDPGRRTHHRTGSVRRSEEHTSELQSPYDLVCRLLLEKKKKKKQYNLQIETNRR